MATQAHGARDALRLAAPALALAAALLLPFLGKPFTIDDTLFLRQAEQALVDPLRPTAFEYVWESERQRVSTYMPSGPVGAWLLTPAAALGGAEWAGHLVTLLLLFLAIVATVRLALRWAGEEADRSTAERRARRAGLLLASAPAVLGMAGTCMPDVAAMAFVTVGIERTVAMLEARGRPARAWLAGATGAVAFAAAILARTHAMLAVVVLGAFFAAERLRNLRPPRKRMLVPWLAGFALALAVLAAARDAVGGAGVDDATGSFFTLEHVRRHVLSYGIYLVLAFPLALPWAVARARRSLFWWSLAGTAFAVHALDSARGLSEWWPLAPVGGFGLGVVACLLPEAGRRVWRKGPREPQPGGSDHATFAALVVWLLLALPVATYVHFAPKYLLLSAPAIAILIAREVASRRIVVTAVVVGALLGLLILRADATLAGAQREAVERLIAPRLAAGEPLRFAGHWGFQWYAEQAGAEPLAAPAPPGTLVVVDPLAGGDDQLDAHVPPAARERLEIVPIGGPGGRVMSDGAGFYSSYPGWLPWSWGNGAVAEFEVWRVTGAAGADGRKER